MFSHLSTTVLSFFEPKRCCIKRFRFRTKYLPHGSQITRVDHNTKLTNAGEILSTTLYKWLQCRNSPRRTYPLIQCYHLGKTYPNLRDYCSELFLSSRENGKTGDGTLLRRSSTVGPSSHVGSSLRFEHPRN